MLLELAAPVAAAPVRYKYRYEEGMHIQLSVSVQGEMQKYFVRDAFTLSLPEGAICRDLVAAMEKELKEGENQPYWNSRTRTFRGPVLLIVDGVSVWDEATPLRDGQSVIIKRFLIGG